MTFHLLYCSLFCGMEDIYCLYMGSLNNLCDLNKQYGLSKCGNEAMFVIEAYRTLRDRSPIPAHQVLKELDGSFGFVIYDHKYGTVFAALVSHEIHHSYSSMLISCVIICLQKLCFCLCY